MLGALISLEKKQCLVYPVSTVQLEELRLSEVPHVVYVPFPNSLTVPAHITWASYKEYLRCQSPP